MKYKNGMVFLSQCGLGAVLIEKDYNIIDINELGDMLLHGKGSLKNTSLISVAPLFCNGDYSKVYQNIGFGEYLMQCPTPEIEDLPPDTRLIVFRDAKKDVCHDMLKSVINNISEAIILCDEHGRILSFNDAAVKMDSLMPADIEGKHITSVYTMDDGSNLAIPKVIEDKHPILNLRQHYTTCYGRNVDIMSNNYPIIKDNAVLGGFSVMEDWSQIDKLSKKVIELQSKLISASSTKKDQKNKLSAKYNFDDIVHNSPVMASVIKKCKQIAKSDSSVMIYGETGTGKEILAQSIHNASQRADGPFLAINCAAIPENLLESLLFGTEKGAYTGAEKREGLFEQANHGTLLLDEINSMNISLQSKLLRVLQENTVRRVGGSEEIPIDVRVLSNTNIPPQEAIEENKLRQDLFYRLGVVNINIPPLRNRKEDIPLLAKFFILNLNKKLSKNVQNIDSEAISILNSYEWPGNVRELQHSMEYALNVIPDNESVITIEYLPEHMVSGKNQETPIRLKNQKEPSLENVVNNVEYRMLCKYLKENKGNISKTARILGTSRQNVQYRIKRYNINIQDLLK